MMSGHSRSLFDPTKDRHREAVASAPVPRNSRVPGSPEWCYQTMSLLKHSYRHIHVDQEHFTHYLNELREHRAWEKVPVDNPYGSEDKMLVAELGKRVDEITVELNAASQELKVRENKIAAQAIDAAAPDLKPFGANQYSDGFGDDKPVAKPSTQNDVSYAIRRLRKDRPDIHARVLAGELTANAGMVEAEVRKRRPSKRKSPLEKVLKLLPQLNDADCKTLFARLSAMLQRQLL